MYLIRYDIGSSSVKTALVDVRCRQTSNVAQFPDFGTLRMSKDYAGCKVLKGNVFNANRWNSPSIKTIWCIDNNWISQPEVVENIINNCI